MEKNHGQYLVAVVVAGAVTVLDPVVALESEVAADVVEVFSIAIVVVVAVCPPVDLAYIAAVPRVAGFPIVAIVDTVPNVGYATVLAGVVGWKFPVLSSAVPLILEIVPIVELEAVPAVAVVGLLIVASPSIVATVYVMPAAPVASP